MRYRFGMTIIFGLFVGLSLGGCNIFGSEKKKPGADAPALQAQLDAFLNPNSKSRISSDVLFEVAKSSRQASEIGILTITRELSQSASSTNMSFPFETLSAALRVDKLQYIIRMDQALALILYANQYLSSTTTKPAAGAVSDSELKTASSRVDLVSGIDPCSMYPDFVVVRLLRVLIDFRTRVDGISQALHISPNAGGFGVQWDASVVNVQNARAINGIITWLADPTTGVLATDVKVILNPESEFGCPSPLSEIIDLQKVEDYIDNTIARSMRCYYINTGDAGNPGIGDNDGDGRVDEELLNGIDDDHDGRIDEDARL